MNVMQAQWWIQGGITHGFIYDVRHNGKEGEVASVGGEVILDDIYQLSSYPKGCRWVDAGCHAGVFSIAAIQAGHTVASAIDVDLDWCFAYSYTINTFMSQMAARGMAAYSQEIDPKNEMLFSAEQIISIALEDVKGIQHDSNALKLDIQGAESSILSAHGCKLLADYFKYMVFEWHHIDDQSYADTLENNGWSIASVSKHTDTLMGIDTQIVSAERR
jgi:hypothetical protein